MSDGQDFQLDTASVNWVDGNGQVHLRVYTSDGNNVTERCYDKDSWYTGAFKQSGEAVSATAWLDQNGKSSIRVYCTLEGETTEWCVDNGSADWYKGGYTAA